MLMMMSISHLVMEAPKKLAAMSTPGETMVRVNLKVVRDTFVKERMITLRCEYLPAVRWKLFCFFTAPSFPY